MSLLLGLLLLASPTPEPFTLDDRLENQEKLNDDLEDRFNEICDELKDGARELSPALAAPGAFPKPQTLVWVRTCSLRALRLELTTGAERPVHLLWEMEGRDASGARVVERGEADGAMRALKTGWQLSHFTDSWRQVVRREVPRFVESANPVGLVFPVVKGATLDHASNLTGGLAVRDFDGDGRPDVVAVDGARLYLFTNQATGSHGYSFTPTLLLQAQKGNIVTSAVAGDFDGDGDVDLVVTFFPSQPPVVLRNDAGRFTEAGRIEPGGRLQSGIASDLDGDGKLDLVLLPYALSDVMPSDMLEAGNGEPLRLFHGDGKLGFSPWPMPKGVVPRRWSLAALSADLLGLGRPQLFVANDFGSKDLYVFDADGGVRNVAAQLGLTDPGNGMSAEIADLDGDGRLDVYTANMFSKAGTRVVSGSRAKGSKQDRLEKFARGNTLYLQQPDGGFREAAQELNINRGFWAFASLLFDYDDDGRLDVAVADGYFSHPKRKDL